MVRMPRIDPDQTVVRENLTASSAVLSAKSVGVFPQSLLD